MHRSQLILNEESDVPYVAFDERKNGPGEVSILFGQEVATTRVHKLDEWAEWNGYLFPSQRSDAGHIARRTVLNRFDTLAERVDLPDEISGQKPMPQMGRRFWYDAYTATHEQVLAEVSEIAAEQSSASAAVVPFVSGNTVAAAIRRRQRLTDTRIHRHHRSEG